MHGWDYNTLLGFATPAGIIGVLGGIITATLLAIFLVPLFFRLTAGKRGPDHPEGI